MKSSKIKFGITGHTGVLGSQLIKENPQYKFNKFNGNITNKKDIKKWLENSSINILFHLAAIVPTKIAKKKIKYANKVNYIGTKILVDEILKYKKIKWFFYSSTSHVYKFSKHKIPENGKIKPISKYGYTKLKGEKYIKKKLENKIPFCIGRIFSFTGCKQSKNFVIPSIIHKAKFKKKNLFKNTNHYRDFLSVKDVCYAIKILTKKRATGIYNIGSAKKVLISDLIKIIFKKYKKEYQLKKNSKQTLLIANNSKIKKLGWKPKKNIKSIINELF